MMEGRLEVKLPTKWRDGKAEVGRVREEKRREDQESWIRSPPCSLNRDCDGAGKSFAIKADVSSLQLLFCQDYCRGRLFGLKL